MRPARTPACARRAAAPALPPRQARRATPVAPARRLAPAPAPLLAPPAALPAALTAAVDSVRSALSPLLASPAGVAGLVAAVVAVAVIKRILDTPSRKYDPANPNVGAEYDAWTNEGILEHYWGEHIHLGYYTPEERAAGYLKKDFKRAKIDFVDAMLAFAAPARPPRRILDVGCGIGGTSRLLAAKFPDASVQGITLSHAQVLRATQLAAAQGLENVAFRVMDALNIEYEEGTFDLVWACESGEHMPDKARYVQQMTRALAPGGTLVIATWCQREAGVNGAPPLDADERAKLQFLYDEWAHPYFVSVEEYGRMLQSTGAYSTIDLADWTAPTLPTWRHSNWVGVFDPWPVIRAGPRVWYKVVREIVTLERMHRAFASGLMVYGMARGVKAGGAGVGEASAVSEAPVAAVVQ